MWVDHLSVARCCAYVAEQNLAEAAALMGRRDAPAPSGSNSGVRTGRVRTKRSLELFCFSFCSTQDVPLGKHLVEPRRVELLTPSDCVGALPKFQAVQPWVVVVIKPCLNSLTFSLL